MPLRPSGRLPPRFRRGFSKATRSLVERRYERRRRWHQERFRRMLRRTNQLILQWQRSLVRWGLVAVVCMLLLVIGLLLFSPMLQLREIKVIHTSPRLSIEEVQQVLAPLFGRHMLFLTSGEITTLLRDHVVDIERVIIQKDYPSTLLVRIELDPLVARIDIVDPEQQRSEQPQSATGSGLDFLSKSGIYVHTPAAQEGEELPLVRVIDWGVRPIPGSLLVPPSMLELLWSVEGELRTQFGHEIQGRILFVRGQEFHIRADNIDLWFDRRSSVEKQIQRYRLFLQSIPRSEVKEYIDLRLSDRVVYR